MLGSAVAYGVVWFVHRPTVALEPFADGFEEPVAMIQVDGRLLVAERAGLVRVVGEDSPMLDLRSKIESGYSEQGLLGLAAADGRLFVDYTRSADGATVVESYPMSGGSAERILVVPQPAALHNGGQLAFGLGDGGDVGLSFARGQSTDDLLGDILRIDVSSAAGYEVPTDNPFVGIAGHRPELWSTGLRNPWRFSFDRATGDMYIGDVGYYETEEIDHQPAGHGGLNYGWARFEGTKCQESDPSKCETDGLTMPLAEYHHGIGQCAVIGGFVYRGSAYPPFAGKYFYGDYCSGQIWTIDTTSEDPTPRQVIDSDFDISAFAEDETGELYVLSLSQGVIYRLVPAR
jgi:glucose/arabinose dehydrogenase